MLEVISSSAKCMLSACASSNPLQRCPVSVPFSIPGFCPVEPELTSNFLEGRRPLRLFYPP